MATHTEQSDYEAILQARSEGRKVDAAVERRVRDRADLAQKQMFDKFGLQNIGTDVIREHRDAHADG